MVFACFVLLPVCSCVCVLWAAARRWRAALCAVVGHRVDAGSSPACGLRPSHNEMGGAKLCEQWALRSHARSDVSPRA